MRLWAVLALGLLSASAQGHWSNPGYLELKPIAPGSYSVVWKVPLQQGKPISITPSLPDSCNNQTPVTSFRTATALVDRWVIHCTDGLTGKQISIKGLSSTVNDVLVRITRSDDTTQTIRLKGGNSSFEVTDSPGWVDVSVTYLTLGVEHIFGGIDHLLFVFALLIIVQGWRRLVATITAFTIAHSITLAAATLGLVNVPRPPVEAMIALSIVFLATEIARRHSTARISAVERPQAVAQSLETRMTNGQSMAYDWPWLVAFTFGLLHGFGFAGALTEVGLPQTAIPLALLFFNVGVEIGQLLFVCGVLLFAWITGRAGLRRSAGLELIAAYLIGAVAAYWTIERVISYWG